jgi:hypothetical protein
LSVIFFSFQTAGYSQKERGMTKVEGYVFDAKTGEPLPFVNIFFKNTVTGTTSGYDGYYKIKASKHNDTLIFSMIGYKEAKVFVEKGKKYRLIIKLKEDAQTLNEVVITPTENPAHVILRKIIKNKKKNNPEKFRRFNCRTYTVLSAKLTNVSNEKTKTVLPSSLLKSLPVVTDSSGRESIPVFFSEKVADNFIDRDENISQTVVLKKNIKAVLGFDNLDIEGYQNSLSTEMNFYNNNIEMFGKTFISPISIRGLAFYKYYLEDSTTVNGRKYYHIKFVPKNKKELAFKGNFTVVKDLWALTGIEAELPKTANINYLNTLKVVYEFDFINDTALFFKRNSLVGTFNYFKVKNEKSKTMIEGSKTTVYTNVVVGDKAHPIDTVNINKPNNRQTDSIINVFRHNTGVQRYNETSAAIDSANRTFWFKLGKKFTHMLSTDYFPLGNIEVGPYFGVWQTNNIEGNRFNIGLRTSENFNRHFSLGGSTGYGFKDKEWKYSVFANYMPATKYRTIFGAGYSKDLYLFGVQSYILLIKENLSHVNEDSFVSSLIKRFTSDRRSMLYNWYLYFEKEWKRGLMTQLKYQHDKLREGVFVPFIHNNKNVPYIYNDALSLRLRLSWNEKTNDVFLKRYYLNTFCPIINIVTTAGHYRVAQKGGNYLKLHLTVKHKIPLGFMRFKYVFETGYILGKVPFPLLELIRGNDTYGDARYRFNLLYNATAALDRYVGIMAEHHFNGLIFNQVPLLRELNIRTVASLKFFTGSLSDKHREIIAYPWDMKVPGKNYLELGLGIENIFQLIRIETIWRPVPDYYSGMSRFGIRIRFELSM